GRGAGTPGSIVFQADDGVDDPTVQAAMTELFTMVEALAEDPDLDVETHPAFASLTDEQREELADADLAPFEGLAVVSPYSPEGASQISTQGEHAGRIAFASLEMPGEDWESAGEVG